MKKVATPLLLTLSFFVVNKAFAIDLLQIYQEAVASDPQYASARTQAQADAEKVVQGRSQLLPQVGFEAKSTYAWGGGMEFSGLGSGTGGGGSASGPSIKTKRPLTELQLGFTQVIYDRAKFVTYEQSKLAGRAGQLKLDQATQNLMVKVAQNYFELLDANNQLQASYVQMKAIERQSEAAKSNFDVGNVTIIDVNVAKARKDQTAAMQLYYEGVRNNKRISLSQFTQEPVTHIDPLNDSAPLPMLEPNDVNYWLEQAHENNRDLQLLDLANQNADAEVEKARSNHYPKVELFGAYKRDDQRYDISGDFFGGQTAQLPLVINNQTIPVPLPSSLSIKTKPTTALGIKLSIPLYAGGAIQSQVNEAKLLAQKTRYDTENAKRQITVAIDQLYNGIQVGRSQIAALQTALDSAQLALDANLIGYEVGMQVNTEILNSQERLFDIERQLNKARYDYLINMLRLKAIAGVLNEADIVRINQMLKSSVAAPSISAPTSQPHLSQPASRSSLKKRSRTRSKNM